MLGSTGDSDGIPGVQCNSLTIYLHESAAFQDEVNLFGAGMEMARRLLAHLQSRVGEGAVQEERVAGIKEFANR